MASAQASDKLLSNLAITHYDYDPDATTATEIEWVDMRDFENFACSFFRTVGTGTLAMTIIANSASDGGGTDVTIKANPALSPDALGDYIFLECTAEEIAHLADAAGVAARYVTAVCTFGTAGDEGVVTYVRGGAKRAYDGLSANSIA
jgi:hypothetical protein